MKTHLIFFLPLFIFCLSSCEKEEITSVEEIALSAVVVPATFSAQEEQEIIVQITTGTPCYSIEVVKTVSDKTFTYNFILKQQDVACIQVVKTHDVPVVFDPQTAGTYTLRFLIDGKIQETREIIVGENSIVGSWQVLRFEDELQNTITSSPEGEEIEITFSSPGFSGATTCNEFQGKYQILSKNNILIPEYITTEQEETDFGKIFNQALLMGNHKLCHSKFKRVCLGSTMKKIN